MDVRNALIRYGLAFESPSEEISYQRFRLDRTYRWIPTAIGLSLVTWLAFSVWDPVGIRRGESAAHFRLLGGLFFVGLLAFSLLPSSRAYWRWTLSAFMLGGCVGTLRVLYLLEPATPFGLSTGTAAINMVIVLGFGLGICPAPLGLGVVLGLATLALYAASVLLWTNLDPFVLSAHLFNLSFILLTFGTTCLWREWSLRRDFEDLRRLTRERNVLDKLVSDVLPRDLLGRIEAGERIAEAFGEVTILFADLVGFTRLTSRLAPRHLVEILDRMFSAFDDAVERCGLEKVKTIGDAYMVIGGTRGDGIDATVGATRLAFEMLQEAHRLASGLGHDLELRIGIHTGSVIGGVIGRNKKVYDYWGETVNVASRLESTGQPGRIRVSETAFWRLKAEFDFDEGPQLELADGSRMPTYFVVEHGAKAAPGERADAVNESWRFSRESTP
jgi:class 3 adenylate cyclase